MEGVPTQRDIEILARKDPVICAALEHWRCGHVTFEEALRVLVVALSVQSKQLQKALLDHKQYCTCRFTIPIQKEGE